MTLVVHAIIWAFVFSLLSAPFGYAAIYACIVLLLLMALLFIYVRIAGGNMKLMRYSVKEFILLWSLTAMFWYPMFLAWFFVYLLGYAALSSLLS